MRQKLMDQAEEKYRVSIVTGRSLHPSRLEDNSRKKSRNFSKKELETQQFFVMLS